MNDYFDGSGGPDDRHARGHEAHLGELAEELRLLAQVVLERVEPVLRRAAAEEGAEWSGCGWCPLCAASALARGENNDMVTTLATYGATIITILREALAGVPVDPVPRADAGTPRDPSADARDTFGDSGDPDAERPSSDAPPMTSGRPEYVPIPVQIKG
ncbi:hypothetical protein [Nocardia alni]|uniref:hypothetical protein n=1 Tax=Nocardia alni TaxID=2815723 RepID=UPI001C21A1C5|nr:hypothetical protein [Nocardia alni]